MVVLCMALDKNVSFPFHILACPETIHEVYSASSHRDQPCEGVKAQTSAPYQHDTLHRLYDVGHVAMWLLGMSPTTSPQPYTLRSKARPQQGTAYERYHEQCRSDLTEIVAYMILSVCTVSVL